MVRWLREYYNVYKLLYWQSSVLIFLGSENIYNIMTELILFVYCVINVKMYFSLSKYNIVSEKKLQPKDKFNFRLHNITFIKPFRLRIRVGM